MSNEIEAHDGQPGNDGEPAIVLTEDWVIDNRGEIFGGAGGGGGGGGVANIPVLTIVSDTSAYNVRTAYESQIASIGSDPVFVRLVVQNGVTVKGSPAITGGNMPAGSRISLVNEGAIRGLGGNAGNGGSTSSINGANGSAGTDAINATEDWDIYNADGTIYGGGGGGGGGGAIDVRQLTIDSNASNYNVRTQYEAAFGAIGSSPVYVRVVVNSGVTVSGSPAMSGGNLPSGSVVILINNGNVQGIGGAGGAGGDADAFLLEGTWIFTTQPGGPGGAGGDAIVMTEEWMIDNQGTIYAGGGGGGGGGAGHTTDGSNNASVYGGGGGGRGRSGATLAGGPGGDASCSGGGGGSCADVIDGGNGGSGSPSGAGGGGTSSSGVGGAGGAWGATGTAGASSLQESGGAGGAAGRAIVANSNHLTFATEGDIIGAVVSPGSSKTYTTGGVGGSGGGGGQGQDATSGGSGGNGAITNGNDGAGGDSAGAGSGGASAAPGGGAGGDGGTWGQSGSNGANAMLGQGSGGNGGAAGRAVRLNGHSVDVKSGAGNILGPMA